VHVFPPKPGRLLYCPEATADDFWICGSLGSQFRFLRGPVSKTLSTFQRLDLQRAQYFTSSFFDSQSYPHRLQWHCFTR
jgi:hypothetical protein